MSRIRWPFVSRKEYDALWWELERAKEQIRREKIFELNIPVMLDGFDYVKLYGTEEDVAKFNQALKETTK